jgi:uncharacterized protein (DUF1778 family)
MAIAVNIDLTPEQESLLREAAQHEGKSVDDLVLGATLWLAQREAADRASLQRSIEQADRGEFISEEEMDARIARMLAN